MQKRAADLVRRANAVPRQHRAPLMHDLASAILDVRTELNDLRGATYAYRQALGDILDAGGVRRDEREAFQQALRYHVSNVMRERLDDETLASLGLRRESALERSREGREERSALVRAARGEEAPLAALKALHAAEALLSRVDPEDLRELSTKEAQRAEADASSIRRRVTALVRVLHAER